MAVSDEEIRDVYLRFFREMHSSVQAGLQTASYLAPEGEERHRIWNRVRQMIEPLELEIGDPFRVAVERALQKLDAEGVAAAMHGAWAAAAAKVSGHMRIKDWNPDRVDIDLMNSDRAPFLVLQADLASNILKWMVVPAGRIREMILPLTSPETKVEAIAIRRDSLSVEGLRHAVKELLVFIRTRYQRGRMKEAGALSVAEYPHELVVGLLPANTEYVARWSLPEEWATESTRELFAMPGAANLPKEIESDHATIRVPDRHFLTQLLSILAERNLVSKNMLGNDLVQVSTEFWDTKKMRWVSVSEVVSAFDAIQPRR